MKEKFSGTYLDDDVHFLLTQVDMPSTNILEKEKKIQTDKSHYSEMISYERKPSENYKSIFYESLKHYENVFSQDVVNLAYKIIEDYEDQSSITLVSLARAGTPIGVLLKRFISSLTNKPVYHYCVSIIRDVGLDLNALSYITNEHIDTSIVFVDGWTGKGVIGKQLQHSVSEFNNLHTTKVSADLYVVLDISGTAYYGASHEDYLIPSAIFNSTISGLISRTIYNKEYLGEKDFHGYVFYDYLQEEDVSVWFVDYIFDIMKVLNKKEKKQYFELNIISDKTIEYFKATLGLTNINYIKPGIGESTRVMLRRVPDKLFVKSKNDYGVQHLILLAKEKNVEIIEKSDLFYNAVAIIKELD